MDRNIEIASTILNQMGGAGKIMAMTGAKKFVAVDNGIQFDFKKNKQMNRVRITLNDVDTYNIKFFKFAPTPKVTMTMTKEKYQAAWDKAESSWKTPVQVIEGVYNDQLKSIFEETTGLYLSF